MTATIELVSETVGGEAYEFVPLGQYIVRAPKVCSGEPTFKYTRIRIKHAMDRLVGGETVDQIAADYGLPTGAMQEAIDPSVRALIERA